jgi:HAD superfamily hydrolase (TIGR01509 family)
LGIVERCNHRLRLAGTLLFLLAAAFAASACQADVDVHVTVNEDGSGIVETETRLDQEASAALLDLETEADGLPLSDLLRSGWNVSPPEREPDGFTVVTASKEFGSTAQFAEIMDEITGEEGVFRNFRLFRTKTFARVGYRVIGTIDTNGGLDSFSDSKLDRALGQSIGDLAAGYGASDEDVGFRFEVALPGQLEGEAPPSAASVDSAAPIAVWNASLGDPDITTIELESATREVAPLALRGVAVVVAVLAGVVVFAQLLRVLFPERRRRSPRRKGPPAKAKRPPPPSVDAPPPIAGPHRDAAPEQPTGPRVVALDGLGVLYRRSEEASRVLVPFARARASTVTDDEIEAKARLLELGRITTGQFWSAIGVAGDPETLDEAYLSQLQLTPGVVKYLRSLRTRGVRVACITNEAAEWAARLKDQHNLSGLIDPWVVSGVVGVRKPDRSIFEVLRRTTGEHPSAILVVDDELDVLDGARALGFATAWFAPDGGEELARGHSIIRRFDAIEDERPEPAV